MLFIVKNADEYTRKFLFRVLLFSAILLVGISYYIYILTGHNGVCLFYSVFHLPCMSCGATTAVMAILRGDISAAIAAHPIFTLAVFPIILIFAFQDFFVCLYGYLKKTKTKTLFEYLIKGDS